MAENKANRLGRFGALVARDKALCETPFLLALVEFSTASASYVTAKTWPYVACPSWASQRTLKAMFFAKTTAGSYTWQIENTGYADGTEITGSNTTYDALYGPSVLTMPTRTGGGDVSLSLKLKASGGTASIKNDPTGVAPWFALACWWEIS
jgi:hypothetical protein